jgi:hypothetical protein
MLSAIIVNKKHVATGHMEPATLKGFVEAAMQLGYAVDDPQSFLKSSSVSASNGARGKRYERASCEGCLRPA